MAKINWDKLSPARIQEQPVSKITGALLPLKKANYTGIVSVNEANYVPPGFVERSRIDATLFTANCTQDALSAVESDDKVISVALSQRLFAEVG